MNKIDKLFNEMLDSIAKLKEAKEEHKKGNISSGELFDIEYYSLETEEQFIKHLQKIK